MIHKAPLTFFEKAAYSLGDVATNFFFQSMILYQTRFYTDTAGLSAMAVGSMFLLVRIADAIFDPIIGALSDRTTTRWGKFRPWILWTAMPFGLTFWLVYRVPNLSETGKLLYAYATYIAVMFLYSANNTPYSALMGVMTADASERTSIATYRFVAAMSGGFLVQAFALPLVDKLGDGDSALGWSHTMGLFAVAMVVFYLITFFFTKERVLPNPHQTASFRTDLKNVLTCRPWITLFALTLLIFAMHVIRGSSTNYLFAYYLDRSAISSFLANVGLSASVGAPVTTWHKALDALGLLVRSDGSNAPSVALSLFLVTSVLIQIGGVLFSRSLSDRFGKKEVFIAGLVVTTLSTTAVILVHPTSVGLLFVLFSLIWAAGWGPTIPLLWVMIADVADFSEWTTSRRATGFMYAGILFALKAGLGIGGALSGWIIAAYGYVPNATQSSHALLGIRLGASVYAAIPLALAAVCLALYPIGKDLNQRIQEDLHERRQSALARASTA